MKQDFEKYFCCPTCGGDLEYIEKEIECKDCECIYPVIDGIPSLIPTKITGIQCKEFQNFYESSQALKAMKLHFGRNALSRRLFITQALLKKYRPNSYLDVSVGSGYFIQLAIRNGVKDVVGIDISLPYLKNLKNKFGDRVLAVQADARHLPLKANAFDYISCLNLIEHLDHFERCIDGLLNSMNNIAVISTDCRSLSTRLNFAPFGKHSAGHLHIFNHFWLRRYLEERAKVERVFLYTFVPYTILPRFMNYITRSDSWGLEKRRIFPAGPVFEFPSSERFVSLQSIRLFVKDLVHYLLNYLEDERIWKAYILKHDFPLASMYVIRKRT